MSRMKQEPIDGLQNISADNFAVVESQGQHYKAIVDQRTHGVFQLTLFACIQFLMGAQSMYLSATVFNKEHAPVFASLLSRLAMYMNSLTTVTNGINIQLDRREVEWLKKLLEARMKHCEHERDTRDDAFNPDTYISQKLLLLDIREWLSVSCIELSEQITKEKVLSSLTV